MTVRVIDLTREMKDGMEAWPGDAVGLRIERLARVGHDGHNLSHFTYLDCHCGTHIDSPLHFIESGEDLTEVPLRIYPAVVVSTSAKRIEPETFQKAGPLEGRAILAHTGWDTHVGRPDFYRDFPYVTPEAARFLVGSGVALLGLDTPSPDQGKSTDHPVHHILLGEGIPIVEGLVQLGKIIAEGGTPHFIAFPLKVKGLEACPVRAAALFFTP